MLWLLITILSYFFFALAAVIDRYILKGPIPSPKVYVFYTGILGLAALFLSPFGFSIPGRDTFFFIFGAGGSAILGVFFLYLGLKRFEASRVVPAFGGLLPILTLVFSSSLGGNSLLQGKITAFVFLVAGSILITIEKERMVTFSSLSAAALIALFFALFFVFAKFVYQRQPFISGYIWINLASFVVSLFFLGFTEVRREVLKLLRFFRFQNKTTPNLSTLSVFFFGKGVGAGAIVLQNFAISLVAPALIAFIGALQGVEYVFLLLLTIVILKEEFGGLLLFQKLGAVGLISAGLAVLVL